MATPTNLPSSFIAGQILTAAQQNSLRGAFRVLQVVQGIATTEVQNNSNTLADTGLTATITPQAATNKILVFVNHVGCMKTNGNAQNGLGLILVRGSTAIHNFAYYSFYTDTALQSRGNVSTVWLDSPSTTSAVTYKTQLRNDGGNFAGVLVQAGSAAASTITLVEISA